MLTRDQAVEQLQRFFAGRPEPIAAAWLFGSVARGTASAASDVDVGVLLEGDPPRTLEGLLLDLEADLAADLGLPVQIVVVNRAPAELVHHVLRDGILIAERSAPARIRFEVRARNEYFDLRPILDRYRGLSGARGGGVQ